MTIFWIKYEKYEKGELLPCYPLIDKRLTVLGIREGETYSRERKYRHPYYISTIEIGLL